MNRIVSANLWDEIEAIAEESKTKLAAIAYVTDDSKVRFGKNDRLIVDASDAAIQSAQTSARVLQKALERGAELYSCPGLHAKVMVLGQTAVIGSANMSQSSRVGLVEAALVSQDPEIVADAVFFITTLAAEVTKIDAAFIRRIIKLPVIRSKPPSLPNSFLPSIILPPRRTWLISLSPLDDEKYASEKKIAKKGLRKAKLLRSDADSETDIESIRFIGKSKFRREAKSGDQIIQIWKPKGTNNVKAVYYHSPIILRQDSQDDDDWTRFYVASAPDAEKTTMTWIDFQRLAEHVALPGRIGKSSIREVPQAISKQLAMLWTPTKKRKAKV